MSSGLTSASTAARAFASNLAVAFGIDASNTLIMLLALGFMVLVMALNFRGASESVKTNVVLTLIELSGLVLVILVGFYACLLYTSDAADDLLCVDLGGRRIIKKKK